MRLYGRHGRCAAWIPECEWQLGALIATEEEVGDAANGGEAYVCAYLGTYVCAYLGTYWGTYLGTYWGTYLCTYWPSYLHARGILARESFRALLRLLEMSAAHL